jgi:PAS domain S-box-containing protein
VSLGFSDGVRGVVARTRGGPEKSAVGEEMFRLLVAQVVDYAIFMLDPEGIIVSWNEGAQRIKGYTADEILGKHFSTFYPEADNVAGKPAWELDVAEREGRFEDEGWRVRKDGSQFWASVVITAVHGPDGVLRGFAKVTRDMTERRDQEERRREASRQEADQLREHADRMARLERTKSEFLNLASHELRGPLTILRGYMSMIEAGDVGPKEIAKIAPLLSAKVAQMELLIKQMLETARLEHERVELSFETFDLRDVAREQVREFAAIAGRLSPLMVSCSQEPVPVRADRARVSTIAANLIDNAIKYSLNRGPVAVVVSARAGYAFLSVDDHGVGIATEDMDKLFTRFGRLDTETNQVVGGTGLGLFLSRELARRHSGDIVVESRPGVGSRFTLTLPIRPAP